MIKTIFYVLLYATLNVSGAAWIKWQLRDKNLSTVNEWQSLIFNIQFVLAFLLIVFSALALFKALSINNFSLIIPLATGINFILTITLGYYLFQDKLSTLSFLGFMLIIGGIIIISLKNGVHAGENNQ